ncbi:ABC transporter substrate-binding protein [Pseudonocardia nigra]|uniref:ABC transporter substrate-binding protein n=1 Tax=Pseudonocardia nigra TaxID=1921578 RepID=UPI001C5E929B|nr:ABC transporter substrate-binding protein [Pseudonocardia nigra]
MTRARIAALATAALATVALTGACSGTESAGFGRAAEGDHVARFVQQPWGDLLVETEIARQVLTTLGYATSVQEVAVPLAAQALATGQADIYLGNWWPSQQDVYTPYLDAGTVEVAGTVLEGTQFSPAVPTSVAESLGITSFADLDEHADAFGRKIYGIEPGTPGNETINKAIEQDAYGLGDWELVVSSTEGMLAEVSRRVARDEPVVFLAWSPHWMTTEFDLHFLEDPEEVWPGAGQVRSVTRSELAETDANLARFIAQIRFDTTSASDFIRAIDKDRKPAEAVALEWMRAHPDRLEEWLEGVTSVSGEPAADVVLARVGG